MGLVSDQTLFVLSQLATLASNCSQSSISFSYLSGMMFFEYFSV